MQKKLNNSIASSVALSFHAAVQQPQVANLPGTVHTGRITSLLQSWNKQLFPLCQALVPIPGRICLPLTLAWD